MAKPENGDRSFGFARRIGWTLFGIQLVAMLAFNSLEYSRFAVTKDFAANAQALWAMSHGHLDPFSTIIGVTFWRNLSEFVMWPLSLVYRIYPHPVFLLWVQDVVVVLTELVTFHWVLDFLRKESPRISVQTAGRFAIAVPVVLFLNPWAYETIAFDFHSHVFAALFLVLAGRDLWAGQIRRLWCWVPLVLLSNAPGALYVMGLGLTALMLGRRTRSQGLALVAVGGIWFTFLTVIGGDGVGGHGISAWFGYLVGAHHGHVNIFEVVLGALRHPNLVAHMFAMRWPILFGFLAVVGLVGVLSPWGAGIAFVVFVPSTLAAPSTFLRFDVSFQSWPALPFVLFGSVAILVSLLGKGERYRRLGVSTMMGWAVCVAVIALVVLPSVPRHWIAVDASAATQLTKVEREVPANAEVIASNGLVGRFAERDFAYVLGYSPRTAQFQETTSIPIQRSVVVFILSPSQGVSALPGQERKAISFVLHHLHARVLVERSGIYAFEWAPPTGTTHITLS